MVMQANEQATFIKNNLGPQMQQPVLPQKLSRMTIMPMCPAMLQQF
jgi:hypothetical protein